MDKIKEIIKRSEFSNILSYLIYGSEGSGYFGKDSDQVLRQSYDSFCDSMEQISSDVNRSDKHFSNAVNELLEIHDNVYFETGVKIGVHLSKELEQTFSQLISEDSKTPNTESVLSSLAEYRMGTTLEAELRKDTEYQKSCEEVREVMRKLDYIGLDKKQWEMVDKVLSVGNERNYDYGKAAYCCGFKDALSILKESIESV